MRQYKLDITFKDIKTFYKQFKVNYLPNPEKWTRPKVNTERSQMNNSGGFNKQTYSWNSLTEGFQMKGALWQ